MTEIERKIREYAASLGYIVRDVSPEQMQEWIGRDFWMACCWQTQSIYVQTDTHPGHSHREFTLLHEVGHAQQMIERYGRPAWIDDVSPVKGASATWPDNQKQTYYRDEQDAWDRAQRFVRDLDLPIPERLQWERRGNDLAKYREFFWPLSGDLLLDF